jgi:hypothetical protein
MVNGREVVLPLRYNGSQCCLDLFFKYCLVDLYIKRVDQNTDASHVSNSFMRSVLFPAVTKCVSVYDHTRMHSINT